MVVTWRIKESLSIRIPPAFTTSGLHAFLFGRKVNFVKYYTLSSPQMVIYEKKIERRQILKYLKIHIYIYI